ncbi:hypothetical protein [Mucilaginibacter sp.]|jgi:hypothetical protein|uniref:hypothetical protein n=1 Tax=Mucilaginibacter sp. TaxID=1882438 RepID=UPI00262DCEE4|nr:hypothetical protein [Mucilaginibacter sp.]MDB5126630.1 hypothetical protein [Mucilaginibacter sp.]
MKNKLKPLVKEARKTAQKAIQLSLVAQLKDITARFGVGSKKLDKQIQKEGKKLAKKFAKDIKVNAAALVKVDEPKALETPKAIPAKTKTVAEPVVKKTAAKTTTL